MSKDEDIDDIDELEEDLDEVEQEEEKPSGSEHDEAEDDDSEEAEVNDDDDEEERKRKTELNRQKRREKKEARLRKRQETENLLREQDAQIKQLRGYVTEIMRREQSRDLGDLDSRINTAAQRWKDADAYLKASAAELRKAIATGDEEAIEVVISNRDKAAEIKAQAAAEYNNFKSIKEEASKATYTEDEPKKKPDFDVETDNRLRADWLKRNAWFDPSGEDSDSLVALAIDDKLKKEGYKPGTHAYWNELDRRVRQRLPHQYGVKKKPPHQMVGGKDSFTAKKGTDEAKLHPEFRKILNERFGSDKNNPERKKAIQYHLQAQKEYKQ